MLKFVLSLPRIPPVKKAPLQSMGNTAAAAALGWEEDKAAAEDWWWRTAMLAPGGVEEIVAAHPHRRVELGAEGVEVSASDLHGFTLSRLVRRRRVRGRRGETRRRERAARGGAAPLPAACDWEAGEG